MLLIWRGLGFLVLLLTVLCVFAAQLASEKFVGGDAFRHLSWPLAAGVAVAGVLTFVLGRRLNKPARKDANPRRPWTHDFFFMRMEWWAVPLMAAAVAVLLTGWTPGGAVQAAKAAGQQTLKSTK